MATNSTIESNLHIAGRLTAQSATLPDSTVTDAMVASDAAISASKIVHRFPLRHSQNGGAVVADATEAIHVARAAGTIKAIEAVIDDTVPVGDSTVTVDLEKGNAASAYASVLSAVLTINSSTVLRTPTTGTITSTSVADGDSLRVVVDATVGTGTLPTGLVVTIFLEESPA